MMKVLSLPNAIKLMAAIGVIAVFGVIVQSCQAPKHEEFEKSAAQTADLTPFKRDSMMKLKFLNNPPVQPRNKFVNGAGETMRLHDFTDQYILVNVWATWCPPCVSEMPSLEKLAETRSSDRFKVITISMDRADAEIDVFFEKNNFTHLTRWRDTALNIPVKLNARGVPVTILYNPLGEEIARVEGEADWASEEAMGLIDKVLGN